MENFLSSNTGFKSRFTDYITLEDYTHEEMYEIFVGMCKEKKKEFAPGFDDALRKRLGELYAERTSDFANARTVRQLFKKTKENVDSRVEAIQDEEEQKREVFIMRPEDLDMTVS
jgi:predicted GIY-YIG superfamily endonuclease